MSTDKAPPDSRLDALAEPTTSVRSLYIATVSIANLAVWAAFFTPLQNLLPRFSEEVAGDGKVLVFGIVSGVGAVIAVIANPLAGALSDRTTLAMGRRRPWVLGGAVVGGLAIAAIPLAPSVATLIVLWGVAQASINAAFAGITASIPD
ncbi:MAG: MFS transporter, partial [Actinomycetes bacterium]